MRCQTCGEDWTEEWQRIHLAGGQYFKDLHPLSPPLPWTQHSLFNPTHVIEYSPEAVYDAKQDDKK